MLILNYSLFIKVKENLKCSSLNHVQLLVTTWAVAHWSSLSMGFSRQEYWVPPRCGPALLQRQAEFSPKRHSHPLISSGPECSPKTQQNPPRSGHRTLPLLSASEESQNSHGCSARGQASWLLAGGRLAVLGPATVPVCPLGDRCWQGLWVQLGTWSFPFKPPCAHDQPGAAGQSGLAGGGGLRERR